VGGSAVGSGVGDAWVGEGLTLVHWQWSLLSVFTSLSA